MGGIISAERRAPSAERRAPSAERRAPSAERRAPSAERRAPSAERRAPSAERRAPSAERRAPSAERRAPSAERRAPSASCVRDPRLLLLAALIVGALCALPERSAEAQPPTQPPTIKTIRSATLTVDVSGQYAGCDDTDASQDNCSSALTPNTFAYSGVTYTIKALYIFSGDPNLTIAFDRYVPDSVRNALTLRFGSSQFALSDGRRGSVSGNPSLSFGIGSLRWTSGQRVRVSLTEPLAPSPSPLRGLRAIPGDGQVTLTWDNPNWFIPQIPKGTPPPFTNNRMHYRWQYRQREGSGMWGAWTDGTVVANDGSVNLSSYQITVVTGLSNDTTYSFEVRGWAGDRYFAATSAVSATPRASVAPVRVTPGPKADELTVAWTAVPAATRHDHGGVGGYCVLRTSGAEKWDDPDVLRREFCVSYSSTSAVLRQLEPGTEYKVRLYWSWNMRWVDQFKLLGEATGTPGAAADRLVTSIPPSGGLEWARVNGAELAMRFDAMLDESSTPASSAFAVSVGDAARGVSAVAVRQDQVTLTLAQAVNAGEAVYVAYTPPSSGKLRRAGGGDVLAFAGQAVTNDTPSTGAEQQQSPPEAVEPPPAPSPLTARVSRAPSEHDGGEFAVRVRFSEDVVAKAKDAAFGVSGGSVVKARRVKGRSDLWELGIAPAGQGAVTVTLPATTDCAASGAVCTADGRKLETALTHTVQGPLALSVADARAQEGPGVTMDFAVTLSRAASRAVKVHYATRDGTAKKGKDYTKAKGTLTFAAGETAKTVSVAVLDDAHDEGTETFRLVLHKPKGAPIADGEATGTIENADPLQQAWLARFGRAAASDAIAAVTARLETPRDAGSHVTLGGHRLSLDGSGAGLPPAGGRGGAGWLSWSEDPAAGASRTMDARTLLMGTSFRAVLGQGTGSQFTSWGQGASVSRFSGTGPGLSLSGETATGALGMDYEHGRLLTGFAMTHSLGEGTAHGAGRSYLMGSSVTTALPYARLALSERVSAWGMAGTGSGELRLDLDGGASERYRADLSMTLAATGVRGELVTPAEAGGFALALKADAFWVRTESDSVSAPGVGNLAAARADASRVRAVLDGSRTFSLAGGATLTPRLELGVRHDGGDAETGTGTELGAGLGYVDPSRAWTWRFGCTASRDMPRTATRNGACRARCGWCRAVPGAA